MRAAKAAGVTRFVLTASVAAIAYGQARDKQTFTEADWTDLEHLPSHAYIQSKTIAERAARDWVAAEGGGIEFCEPTAKLSQFRWRQRFDSFFD